MKKQMILAGLFTAGLAVAALGGTQTKANTIAEQVESVLPSPQIFSYHDNVVQFPRDLQLISYKIEASCVSDGQDPDGDLAPGKYLQIKGSNKDQFMLHCGRNNSTKVGNFIKSTLAFAQAIPTESTCTEFPNEANFATVGTLSARYNGTIYRFEHVLLAQLEKIAANYWLAGQTEARDCGFADYDIHLGAIAGKAAAFIGYSDDYKELTIPLKGDYTGDHCTFNLCTRDGYAAEETISSREKRAGEIDFYYVDEQGKELQPSNFVVLDEGDYYYYPQGKAKEIPGYSYLGLFDENGNKVTGDVQALANQSLKYYYRYEEKLPGRIDFYYVNEEYMNEIHPVDSVTSATLDGADYLDPATRTVQEIDGYTYIGLFDEKGYKVTGNIQIVRDQVLKYYYYYEKRDSVSTFHYIGE